MDDTNDGKSHNIEFKTPGSPDSDAANAKMAAPVFSSPHDAED